MKKVLSALCICGAMLVASCTTYTPIAATSNPVGNKCGTASYATFLGLGGSANLGINRAAKEGGITKISHVDLQKYNFLYLYQKTTLLVYGE